MPIASESHVDHAETVSPFEVSGSWWGLSLHRRARVLWQIFHAKDEIVGRWAENQTNDGMIAKYGVQGIPSDRHAFRSGFVWPLLKLLMAYLATGQSRYKALYLDERLRFAPHRSAPTIRAQFFAQLVVGDQDALLDILKNDPSAAAKLRNELTKLHKELCEIQPELPVRILLLGDCLLNEVRVFLPLVARGLKAAVDMRSMYFSAALKKGLSTEEASEFIERESIDLVVLSFLSYSGIPPYEVLLREADTLSASEVGKRTDAIVGIMYRFLEELRKHTDAPFLLHNASGLPLTRWRRLIPFLAPLSKGRRRIVDALNSRIAELAPTIDNTIVIDEFSIAQQKGLKACSRSIAPRLISRGAMFHSTRFGEYLAPSYAEIVLAFSQLSKAKVLLVDFDNTLWQGVMADGPVVHRVAEQTILKRLKDAGILLVALSKNDAQNVRWNEMVLKREDFALEKIGWGLKAESIVQAAQQLDLGLDTFVLLDDNPVERELVVSQLPAVKALDSTEASVWRALTLMLQFPNTRKTEEARRRTALYREQANRRQFIDGQMDYAAMMGSLDLKVEFLVPGKKDMDRATELVQRTNQFNTTTIRYTKQQIGELLSDPTCCVYAAKLADKFGPLGLVGLIIIRLKTEEAIIDSFVMSCRAMGFELEKLMLWYAIESQAKDKRIVGKFIPTDRNSPAQSLYPSCAFVQQDHDTWVLPAGETPFAPPTWFSVTDSVHESNSQTAFKSRRMS